MKTNQNQKKTFRQALAGQFGSRQFKNGNYSLAMIALVLAIAVFVNLIVGQLPKSLTDIDISDSLIYGTGDVTEEVLSGLDTDVDILVIAENDSVDERITRFLERYAEQSSHVSLFYRDPVLHPDVLTEYGVSANTVVVSCEATGKTTTVALNDMIQYDDYYLYYQGSYVETEFDGEGLITSAINSVARGDTKQVYLLEGHGESALSDSVKDLMKKSSLVVSSVDLMKAADIPDDCELLVINGPQTDLAQDELSTIMAFLKRGGNVMLLRGATEKSMANFDNLMREFGLEMVNETIGDAERFYQLYRSYYNFFPVITNSSLNIGTDTTLLVSAVGGMLCMEETPDSVSIEQLLTTGEKGFSAAKPDETKQFLLGAKSVRTFTQEEQEEDASGSSALITGEETMPEETESTEEDESETETEKETQTENETQTEEETTAKEAETKGTLLVLTTPSLIDEEITSHFSNIGNLDEFMSLTASFFEDVENISIPSKSLAVSYNTVTNPGMFTSLFIFVIPVFCIVCGLLVWIRRRKA